MAIIELKNVTYRYTRNMDAVRDVSLTINPGEHVCILGHNGSGKSTLAKLIMGIIEPLRGEIFINGEQMTPDNVDELRKHLGIVFQNPDNQFVGVTVLDDIAFGMENRQVPRDEMLARAKDVADKVGMDEFLDRNPEELSGGEKQRVAIAGILALDPDVIILDEATSMLDPQGVKDVNDVINGLQHKKTIIAITHNLHEALRADRVIVMKDGEIIAIGTPREIFANKAILKSAYLDILQPMKLIELLETESFQNKAEIIGALWELNYEM